MNTTPDNIKAILQGKIAEFLDKPFALKDYCDSEDDNSVLAVSGVITRYDEPVNVRVRVKKDGYEPYYWSITDDDITFSMRFISTITLGKDVCVSDPCYKRDVWCMTVLNNVKPGIWNVRAAIDTIDSWGERNYVLELQHRDMERTDSFDWTERFELGVDSGTMSVIDDAYYNRKNGSVEEFESDDAARERFLEECWRLADKRTGIYRVGGKAVGVVCSSGIGDGGYPLYVVEKDGEVIAMKISFV